jgi:hypothetical protein
MTTSPKDKLRDEIAHYEANRAMLVEQHRGEFVLIKGQRIVGYYKSEVDALKAGYEHFGSEAFLVRVCAESEKPILFTSLYVGR